MSDSASSIQRYTILDWSTQDRPREKFIERGAFSLSDAELIAILLRTGTSSSTAVDLAKQMLGACNNKLSKLADLSYQKLKETKGIGSAKAVTLLAAFEIGKRLRAEKVSEDAHIRKTEDVVEFMQDKIANLSHEEFWTIYLSQSCKIIEAIQIGKGGINSTTVDIRLIFKNALLNSATNVIICHNHPSGNLQPSQKDTQLTAEIQKAAKTLNIRILDHVIIHKNHYFSFHEEALI